MLARELPARRKDVCYLMPNAKFDRGVATIKPGVPRLIDWHDEKSVG
jgi:hypothetical protein